MKLAASLCTLVLLAASCTPAQSQGSLTLEKKLPVTFGQLSNVVELGDGRVAFADTKAKLFLAADLNTGKVDTLGTRVDSLIKNPPPEHYKFPGWVARLGGDTVALVDFSALRTTVWGQDGKSRGVLPIPPVAGTAPVLVYDTVGHGYKVDYRSIIGGAEPGTTARPDSVPVLRLTLKTGKADTVANLASPEYGEAMFGTQMQQAAKVFAPNDFFGVLPNGEVWLQRPRAQEDAALTYDVFNRQGGWQRAVEFPKGASLAGFGAKGAVYGSIKEADGKRTVGRFALK